MQNQMMNWNWSIDVFYIKFLFYFKSIRPLNLTHPSNYPGKCTIIGNSEEKFLIFFYFFKRFFIGMDWQGFVKIFSVQWAS